MDTWIPLNILAPERLIDARLQLHWAAQIAATVGYSFIPPEPDWRHVSLSGYSDASGYMLVSQPVKAHGGFRVGLRLADLTLVLLNEANEIRHAFALTGHTLDEGYDWLAKVAAPAATMALMRPDHELPDHRVGKGDAFKFSDREAFALLASWYTNATPTLEAFAAAYPAAGAVRCWPHHFDIASLWAWDPEKDPEEGRSIGVGFVPGDTAYPVPYIYVTPWPYPECSPEASLKAGHWHTENWVGAVLRLEELGPAAAQGERVRTFIEQAVAASSNMLS
ncbi:MAG: DUF5996 family protein [Bacteroidota bacterium]